MEEDYFETFERTMSITRKCDSGRPKTSRTAANTSDVNDHVLSQEGAPKTHLTSWQIARKTGISRLSAVRIIRNDLHLQVCEKKRRSQELSETEANCVDRLL